MAGDDDDDQEGVARALVASAGGELIEYDRGIAHIRFPTAQGTLQAAFEVSIEGSTLHLKQFALYPLEGGEPLDAGVRDVLAYARQAKGVASNLGFLELRITGIRITGANPGKTPDLRFPVTLRWVPQ